MFYNFRTEKSSKISNANFQKKLCSQPEIIFLGFKALCSKVVFCVFSEKKWLYFSKMDIFRMSFFQNMNDFFISCFSDNYIN